MIVLVLLSLLTLLLTGLLTRFLLLLVLFFPQLTHLGMSSDSSRLPLAPLSDEEFNKRLNEMIKLPELDTNENLNRH